MRAFLLLMLAILALLLAACPFTGSKPKTDAAQQATGYTTGGPAGRPAGADPGSGQGQTQAGAGTTVVDIGNRAPAGMPEGWPETLPAYPEAAIKMSQNIGSGGTAALNVILETKAAPQDVLRFYDEKAKAAGFTNALQVNTKDGGGMYRYESDKQAFSVTAAAGATGTTITLVLSQK
jgi:hypothetical protein